MTPQPLMDSSRETLLYELCLQQVFRRPYAELRQEAVRSQECDEMDLLNMGRQIYLDLPRLARGEISSIAIPHRLPRRGEYQPV